MSIKQSAPGFRTGRNLEVLDVLGPTIEFLPGSNHLPANYCIMRGKVPPGIFIPLHSHDDFETFIMVSGELDALQETPDGPGWISLLSGDVLDIPGGTKHAFHNRSAEPAVAIIISTAKIGNFFREIGRSIVPGSPASSAPPLETIQHFLRTAERYGYWIATPEENAAVGLQMPDPKVDASPAR
jgi:quercetin dioxygenase-like cupin family protein